MAIVAAVITFIVAYFISLFGMAELLPTQAMRALSSRPLGRFVIVGVPLCIASLTAYFVYGLMR